MALNKSNHWLLPAASIGVKPAQVRRFLTLLKKKPLANNELLSKMGLAKSMLTDLKKVMSPYLQPSSAVTQLNPAGKKLAKKIITPLPNWSKIEKKLAQLQTKKSQRQRQYDQFPATLKTVVNRVKLLFKQNDLEKRDLLFLGDSDTTSLAAALTGLANSILVLDIDSHLIEFFKKTAFQEKLNLKCHLTDLSQPLALHFQKNFDVVFTDPPYTPAGNKLFLSRAIQVLKPQSTSSLYFCYGTSQRSLERELKIQQLIVQMGLVIKLKLPGFNHYQGAQSIGSTSDLYLCQLTPQTKPLVYGIFKKNIYTHL